MTTLRHYTVSLHTAAPRTIAAVHARIPAGGAAAVFRRYLDQVYAASRAGAVQLDGQNVFVYRPVTDSPGELHVAFGVGVTAPFVTTGLVEPTPLPIGETATTTHWGSYAGLRSAHAAIAEWCEANGRRRSGPSWEVYGHWTDEPSKVRTDVFYLLDPA